MTANIRIVGISTEPVANFRHQPHSKSGGLFAALDREWDVVGIVRPTLSKSFKYLNKLRYFHPDREYWIQRSVLNPRTFRQRTVLTEHQLQPLRGTYDVIMQLHTLMSPGLNPEKECYVLHTDNTYLMSERYYRKWAPLRGRQRNEWLQLEKKTYQNAAFLFPRSHFLRRSLIEDYGCDPERVIRVGGGANLAAASIADKQYDKQIALFVGYDFERKGGFTLLKAWDTVHQQLPEAELWIVGPKRPYTPDQKGIRWLGQVQDRQALAHLYEQASLFVMPSLFEPWGHVFFEAMGYGLPCVATNHCAMPEIIEDGVTGLLVPPGDHEALAAQLVSLLDHPVQAEAMGRRAYAHVQHGYTWDDVVTRMAPYIEQAVHDHRGTTPAQRAVA